MLWNAQEDELQGDGKTTNRKIDPEAPTPRDFCGEDTAEHRTEDSCTHKDTDPHADKQGAFARCGGIVDDQDGAAEATFTRPRVS